MKRTQVFSAETDGLGDWRRLGVDHITSDLPGTAGSAPAHKAGAKIYPVVVVSTPKFPILSLATPSATALALNASVRAAERAVIAWNKVDIQTGIPTPEGPGQRINPGTRSEAFDYLEDALAAAISAFQAIEAFANYRIGKSGIESFSLSRDGEQVEMSNAEVQRRASTTEKLISILPAFTGVKSIKGGKLWPPFKELMHVRNASVHFKYADQYGSYLYKKLLSNNPFSYAETAAEIILCYADGLDDRWCHHIRELYQT